ncbi:glycosyltransferase family 39 protein [Streptomyces rimosus]|uniref:glycosyltransferase family 39 protein n=1 Tax=Streptomyces rimosus TaxID=1927 RepID=UPI00099D2D0D|nr:glycosyltransferase family 39 protein [Streptomyces rimosus]
MPVEAAPAPPVAALPTQRTAQGPVRRTAQRTAPAALPGAAPSASALARLAVPALPALLALALGLWGIRRGDSLWRDEAVTWQVGQRSVAEIWHMLGEVDVVHGLYYVLMHGVFEVFGTGPAVLRMPSVLAVALAAAATAAAGRRLAGPWAGLAAGLVLALIPNMQHYAQEGRAYALVTAGVAVATQLLVGASPGARRSWPRWAAYAAVMLTSALLNWFSLFVLPAHAVTVLVARRRGARPLVAPWSVAAAVVVAGALPLIQASRAQAGQVSWIKPVAVSTLLGIAVLVLVALVCARVPYPGRGREAMSPASVGLPLLVVPQCGLLLASVVVEPLYLDRYVLYTNIGFALLLGVGLAAAVQALPVRTWVLLTGVTALGFVALLPVETGLRKPTSRADDVLRAAHRVAASARSGDGVLFVPAARRDTALVTPSAFTGLDDLALTRDPVSSGTIKGVEGSPEHIRTAMLAEHRIVVVTDTRRAAPPAPVREAEKLRVLARHFKLTERTDSVGRRVEVYEKVR